MADGSPEDRAGLKQMNNLTFTATDKGHRDSKKCSDIVFDDESVKLSYFKKRKTSESCDKSDRHGVAEDGTTVVTDYRKPSDESEVDDRKKRCIDRYDSSESSDR